MSIFRTISKILLIKSFIFGTLVLIIWVRSYFAADVITVKVGLKSASVASARGLVIYRASADGTDDMRIASMTRKHSTDDPAMVISSLPRNGRRVLGFSHDQRPMFAEGGGLVLTVTIPFWLFFILTSSKALIWLIRRNVRKAIPVPAGPLSWCVKCQCDQPSVSFRCTACGARMAA